MPDKPPAETREAIAEEMANRRLAGESIGQIAKAVGRTPKTVYVTLNSMQLAFPALGRQEIRDQAETRRQKVLELLGKLGGAATSHQLHVRLKAHYPGKQPYRQALARDLQLLESKGMIEKYHVETILPLRGPPVIVCLRQDADLAGKPTGIYPDNVCQVIVQMARHVKGHHSYDSMQQRLMQNKASIPLQWRRAILEVLYERK